MITSCTNLFLIPSKQQYYSPEQFSLEYREIYIDINNKEKLHAWLLNPENTNSASILFFHGNAENITSHIASVIWLAKLGYRVLLVDYRGYGKSSGKATIENASSDVIKTIQWYNDKHQDTTSPLIVFGQSLGASLVLYGIAAHPDVKEKVTGIIAEAGFYSYRQIARHALSQHWLTNIIKYPASFLVTNKYSPNKALQNTPMPPILFVHSVEDEIIPFENVMKLHEVVISEKELVKISGRHIASANSPLARDTIEDFIKGLNSHP